MALIIDDDTVAFLSSTLPEPTAADFAILTADVVRIRVFDGGTTEGRPMERKVLLSISEKALVDQLLAKLQIEDDSDGDHCLCYGDPTIELMRADGMVEVIGVHHGFAIRSQRWRSDARLSDGRGLLEVLDRLGVTAPLARFVDAIRRAERWEADKQAWCAAMPANFPVPWEQLVAPNADIQGMYSASVAQAEDPVASLVEMLAWFGSGRARGAGTALYESNLEEIICLAPRELLLHAFAVCRSRPARCGVARLVWSFAFRQRASGLPWLLRARFFFHPTTVRRA